MNYQRIYTEEYFSGKNSFFYKLGYGRFAKFYFNNLFKPLKPYLKKLATGKVLDIGCAFGFMLKRVPDSFQKFGIDISQYAINAAKKTLPKAAFIVHNAEESFPFQNNFFDIVICNDVLEHLENPDLALKNIYTVLKPEGILYINTPNFNTFRKKILKFADEREHHISLFPHDSLRELLVKLDFKIIEHWTYFNFTYFFFLKFKSKIGTESAFICTK